MTTVAAILIKATIVLTVALVGASLARRSSAAMRHVLLAAAFVVLLALPIASVVAPKIPVTVPVAVQQTVASYSFQQTEIPSGALPAALAVSTRVVTPPPSPRFEISTLLLAVWATCFVAFLLPIAAGLWQVRTLQRAGVLWPEGQAIADEVGGRRRVAVLLSDAVSGPMTCGVVRPAVMLPTSALSWTVEDLRRAMIHELEHVGRFDWVTHCFARAMCTCYWFHPLVWIAKRQLVLEAERACDDAVLRRSECTAYADQLVGLAEQMSTTSKHPLLAMANPGDLTMRVRAILDQRQRRTRAGMFRLAIVMSAAALFVIAVSSLRMVTAEPGIARFEVAPLIPKSPAPPQVPQAITLPASTPKWEVVSIKPCENPGGGGGTRGGGGAGAGGDGPPIQFSADRMTMRCQTVMALIQSAYLQYANARDVAVAGEYAVAAIRIEGSPDWINSERYTIEAKAEKPVDPGVMRGPMLQALLEDRFKLKLRREAREVPLLALTVAKGGPKMKPHQEGSCTPRSGGPSMTLPPGQVFCAFAGRTDGSTDKHLTLTVDGLTVAEFIKVYMISVMHQAGKPIIDKTGLTGRFDFRVEYAFTPQDRRDIAESFGRPESDFDTGPVFIDAVQEQLGFKLEETKGPWDHIVIDRVERPSPN